jgi:type VI secretion system protein ImpK
MTEAAEARGRKAKTKRRSEQGSGPVAPADLNRRLNEAVRPCLTMVVQLQLIRRERKPPPELAYQHVKAMLTQTFRRIEALRLPPLDSDNVRYALVAFIDEMMQLESGPTKEFWQSRLLQLEYFGETRAGEGFFERLEELKRDENKTVLHVYYLCLLLGFHGIYGQHGELERENLVEELRGRLGFAVQAEARGLSPHGARPDEPGVDQERNRLIQWLAIGAAVMAVVWYFGLLFTLDAQESNLTEILKNSYEDVRAGLVGSAE